MTQQTLLPSQSSARLSEDGRHRYRLTRRWGDGPALGWCMLNPSTADHTEDDPTIRRCLGFARAWGFSAIEVVNLWSWRATDPTEVFKNLHRAHDAVTDEVLLEVALACSTIVVAWGFPGGAPWGKHRADAVLELLRQGDAELLCLGRTNNGAPRHPLYIAKAQKPEPYLSPGSPEPTTNTSNETSNTP